MGGFGSTRWGWRSTRATTDHFLALDIRVLARHGYFTAGPGEVTSGTEAWQCNEEEVGRVDVQYRGTDPPVVTLNYGVHRPGEEWHPIREWVGLERTPCTFGGARCWFVCPGCSRRCAMLYGVDGLFRCRLCHDLAYRSTREKSQNRSQSRHLATKMTPMRV